MMTAMRIALAAAAGFLASVMLSGPVAAWSPEGHEIVARLAALYLTKPARLQVEDLLGGGAADSMAAASGWADDVSAKKPETRAWHFVNIPVAESGYVAQRDCKGGNCAVARAAAAMKTLADKSQPREARVEALKWLINLMGDIHQPLRCGDDGSDHGRNVKVLLGGKEANLFDIWENRVIKSMRKDVPQLVSMFSIRISPERRKQWSNGTLAGWCEETARVAKESAYDDLRGAATQGGLILLGNDYPEAKRKVTGEQLEKAGVRLAAALNFSLK